LRSRGVSDTNKTVRYYILWCPVLSFSLFTSITDKAIQLTTISTSLENIHNYTCVSVVWKSWQLFEKALRVFKSPMFYPLRYYAILRHLVATAARSSCLSSTEVATVPTWRFPC